MSKEYEHFNYGNDTNLIRATLIIVPYDYVDEKAICVGCGVELGASKDKRLWYDCHNLVQCLRNMRNKNG